MKLVAVLGAALLAVAEAFAGGNAVVGAPIGFGNVVFPGTGHVPVNPHTTGFGNVIFPGTGRAPGPRLPFSITNPGFGAGLAGTVSGSRPYPGVRGGGAGRVVYMPYAYPVYMGNYGFDQQQQPNVVVVYPQPQSPVVINQQVAQPAPEQAPDGGGVKLYQAPARSTAEMAAAEPATPGYLFAFKDHSIYSAVAYWVQGDTLHYFTAGNTHNQVSLSLLDRPLTERLNKERGVSIQLPPSR
ncbi:MAG: hypothetical protein M1436_08180 [Acidobacteria bacterium]|nr:hypothetical protein [Acidobacteriota bacterium]